MGRPQKELDVEALLDLVMRGEKPPAIAKELDTSEPTIRKRIAEIQQKQSVILQYRALQSLQLTELQMQVLEAITPDKINEAPLRDLIMAYKILKEKEVIADLKPGEVKGLIAHLIFLEQQDRALLEGTKLPDTSIVEAEYSDTTNEGSEKAVTLSELDKRTF